MALSPKVFTFIKTYFTFLMALGPRITDVPVVGAQPTDPELSLAEDLPSMSVNSTCSDWMAWKPPLPEPAVIMQVVSQKYIEREVNFIHVMERNTGFTRNNLLLVCLDQESVQFFAESSLGIRCVPLVQPVPEIPEEKKIFRKLVWKIRVQLLRCLLVVGGVDVIVSDSDALWIGDLRQFLYPSSEHISASELSIAKSSVIASRGDYPPKQNMMWGSTMCMGFAVFRANNMSAMEKFAGVMERITMSVGDDQVAVNRAAYELGITWKEGSDMRFTGSVTEAVGTIDSLPLDEEGLPFTVTMVPHRTFVRKCSTPTVVPEDTVVIHCHDRKSVWMKEADLWDVDQSVFHGA